MEGEARMSSSSERGNAGRRVSQYDKIVLEKLGMWR